MTYYYDDFERAHDRLDDEIAALSERAVKAEAEADRLREAIEEHQSDVGIGLAGWERNSRLWAALDAEDGDE